MIRCNPTLSIVLLMARGNDAQVAEQANAAPTAAITAPKDMGSVVWTRDLDGEVGAPGADADDISRLPTTLTAGPLSIEVGTTDEAGLKAVDSIGAIVVPDEQDPRDTISAPQGGTAFLFGQAIQPFGAAEDPQESPMDSSLPGAMRPISAARPRRAPPTALFDE